MTSSKRTKPEQNWGSDVPISMPEPPSREPAFSVPLGGICMTEHGIQFDLTETDRQEFYSAPFGPRDAPEQES